MPLGEGSPKTRGRNWGILSYFAAIGLSNMKTVADKLIITYKHTSTSDELLRMVSTSMILILESP